MFYSLVSEFRAAGIQFFQAGDLLFRCLQDLYPGHNAAGQIFQAYAFHLHV